MSIVKDVLKKRKPEPQFPVLASIARRFSPRVFSPEPILEKDIQSIMEAARLAPSGRNTQPWMYLVVKKQVRRTQK